MSRYAIYAFIVITAVAYAFGVYVGRKANSTTQTTKQVTETTSRQTTIVKDPSGRQVTTINEHIDTTLQSTTKKVRGLQHRAFNVSGLAGVEFSHFERPIYGLQVSKELIGPITVGLTYINVYNGLVLISGGLNF